MSDCLPSVRPYVRQFNRSTVCQSIRPNICEFKKHVFSCVRRSIRPYVHPPVCASVHLAVQRSVHLQVRRLGSCPQVKFVCFLSFLPFPSLTKKPGKIWSTLARWKMNKILFAYGICLPLFFSFLLLFSFLFLFFFFSFSFLLLDEELHLGLSIEQRSDFLDAPSHLYKRVCPSVRPSVGP